MKVGGQFHVPVALPPGETQQHPVDGRLGGLHDRSTWCGEEKLSEIEHWPFSPYPSHTASSSITRKNARYPLDTTRGGLQEIRTLWW
jgi:hypothetical protein